MNFDLSPSLSPAKSSSPIDSAIINGFGGGFGGVMQVLGGHLQTPPLTRDAEELEERESWHTPIEPSELLQLDQELAEEKKNSRHDYHTQSTADASSSSSTVTSTPTPTTMDLDRICFAELRRLLVRLAADSRWSHLCFTHDMIQCISNVVDDVVQYILTYSSTTPLPSTSETVGVAVSGSSTFVYQINYERPVQSGLHFGGGDELPPVRQEYAQQPNDPHNWCRSTRVTKNLVDRWYQRYQTISPEPLPASLLVESERAVLGSLIELFLTKLIDGLGESVQSISTDSMFYLPSYSDLWIAVSDNSFLSQLTNSARIQFDLSRNRPWKWRPLNEDKTYSSTKVTYIDAFKLVHQDSMDRMNQLNRTSWYMQPEKLFSYAQQFVRGQLSESSSIKRFRSSGIQPLQFYASQSGRLATFVLIDAVGATYPFVCETTSTDAEGNIVHRWRIRSLMDGSLIYQFNPLPTDYAPWNPMVGMLQAQFQFVPTPSEQYLLKQFEQFKQGLDATKIMISEEEQTTAPGTASSSSPSTGMGDSIFFGTGPVSSDVTSAISQFQERITNELKQVQKKWKEPKFERLFTEVEPLTRFSLFGPTIYKENHPIEICRLFHSHVMDTALIDSGIQPLPRVLNELISQYACIDLPFIEGEAREQMSRYPPSPAAAGVNDPSARPLNSSEVMVSHANYPSGTSNPIETIPSVAMSAYHWNSSTRTVELMSAAAPSSSSGVESGAANSKPPFAQRGGRGRGGRGGFIPRGRGGRGGRGGFQQNGGDENGGGDRGGRGGGRGGRGGPAKFANRL